MSVDPVRVRALYDSTIEPRLAELEGLRLKLRGLIIRAVAFVSAPVLLWWAGDFAAFVLPPQFVFLVQALAFVLIIVGVIVAGMRYLLPGVTAFINYKARFKQDIVSEVFKIVSPTAEYAPQQGIAKDVFVGSGIFDDRGSYSTDDRVRGRIGNTPFEAAEVKRQYSTGGKNSQTRTVFHGLFFHLDFNKALRGATVVQPETANSYQIGDRRGMTLVALEDPDFEKEFKVWTTNEVEARYILTPAMMERLMALRREASHPVFLGFQGHRAHIGIHYGRSLFEPSIASTTSRDAIDEMARHFSLAEFVVHELDLNTRIWTKGVDESLLHAPDAATDSPLDALAAAKPGSVTEQDLWQAATAAVGVTEADEQPQPTPGDTRIQIQHGADGATVSYGFSVSSTVCLLISAACALACIAALRALGTGENLGPVAALQPALSALPSIPVVDAIVGPVPLAWLIGGAFVGSFLSLGWLFHVHKVEITGDTVYIRRGLRPFARRYARPPYDRVVRLDNSVHIAKTGGGVTLFHPTASPNLTKDEARWVASEMHRAMRQTAPDRVRAAASKT